MKKDKNKKMNRTLTARRDLTNLNTALEIQETAEGKLLSVARGELAIRNFVIVLNEKIPAGAPGTTSRMSIWNWENGVHPVGDSNLWAWREFYGPDELPHRLAVAIITLRTRKYEKGSAKITEQEAKKLLEAVTQ